jgi:hypothetical protein
MIPTKKSEPKHLRIDGTSHTRKNDENSSKETRKSNELQTGIDATMKASIHLEVRFFTNGGKI